MSESVIIPVLGKPSDPDEDGDDGCGGGGDDDNDDDDDKGSEYGCPRPAHSQTLFSFTTEETLKIHIDYDVLLM